MVDQHCYSIVEAREEDGERFIYVRNPHLDENKEAMYFSRSHIPYWRGEETDWDNQHTYYKHIGMYGYRSDILKKITSLKISSLEKAESLEQLRWLENGFKIKTAETTLETVGIDTPADLEHALKYLKSIDA